MNFIPTAPALKSFLKTLYRMQSATQISKNNSYIRIEAEKKQDDLIISIEDNGIGIGPRHLPKIFDMFYRAVEHSRGSGIGLFLVRESVKMVRGTISVHSTLGMGTTFVLTLPCLKQVKVNQLSESQPCVHS